MRVTLTQRGGFVGDEVTLAQIETEQLGPEARRGLERQIDAAIASTKSLTRPVGADLLEYRLVVEDQGRHDAIAWTDDGGPQLAPMRDLLARLQHGS